MKTHDAHKALIIKAKEKHGLTDAGLAERIGATQSAVSRWLSGARGISGKYLPALRKLAGEEGREGVEDALHALQQQMAAYMAEQQRTIERIEPLLRECERMIQEHGPPTAQSPFRSAHVDSGGAGRTTTPTRLDIGGGQQ